MIPCMAFERIPQVLEALEEALCRAHGDMTTACRTLGIPIQAVHLWKLADPEVSTRLREAQMLGWATLESAAYRRAVEGISQPVFYKDEIVGYKTEYSDTLLARMLQARVPGYGDAADRSTSLTVNVAIMPRASSYEEWVTQRELALEASELKQVTDAREEKPSMEVIRERVRAINTRPLPDVL